MLGSDQSVTYRQEHRIDHEQYGISVGPTGRHCLEEVIERT